MEIATASAQERWRRRSSGGEDHGADPIAGPTTYPMLTKTNYNDWALLMKIKF
jgi:hypothetical protein